jgi:type II secretory pathway component PulJ
MRTLPNLRNAEGLTIVEVMIAGAILMVVALMIANVLTNTSKQQSRIEERADRADFIQTATIDLRMKPIPLPSPSP